MSRLLFSSLLAVTSLGAVALGMHPGQTAVDQELPSPSLPKATRGPVRIAFSSDGAQAFVAESDDGTVAVVDTRSGQVIRRFPTDGTQPSALALTPSGLLVANTFSGSLLLLDPNTGERKASIPLRGEPSDIVTSADGGIAFVSLAQLDQVAVLELPSLKVTRRLDTGDRPRAMTLTPDGRLLLVANFRGGDVSVFETKSLQATRRVSLTGVNLRGITVTPDGKRAYVTGQIAANTRSTKEPLDIWTNTVFTFAINPGPGDGGYGERADVAAEGWIDFPLNASPDPDGIVALEAERVAVALAGSDQALLVRTPGPHHRTYDPVIEKRTAVGARPRGIALTPNRQELWVANELDSTLSVLDAKSLEPLRTIRLGIPDRTDARMEGRYLFGNAKLTRGRQFTCESCHPKGGTDGLRWEFIHVPDGMEFRNSRNLRGQVTATAPFRWSGHEKTIDSFLVDEVIGLLGGPEPTTAQVAALRTFLENHPMPPNPYRADDGTLTEAAQRGKALFEGKAGCIGCHSGDQYGGTGLEAWVGTTQEGYKLDVPHLHGVHDSAPYLHDARAQTLDDIFQKHNRAEKHGNAHQLSPQELADVLRFVREL